jgi:hypothetical protein
MNVVGHDKGDFQLAGDFQQGPVDHPLLLQAVIL